MILAIDIGNTNIVVGCIEGEKILFTERISTNSAKTELEYVAQLSTLLELYKVNKDCIDGCILSSVVPQINYVVIKAVDKFLGINPMVVGPGVKTGLNILMDNPASVGADLIVNAVAGLAEYGAPLILIDMGTATTISVINDKNNYVGGLITPGVKVSIDSLVSSTSQLPRIAFDAPDKIIGRNTVDSMQSGIIYGQASLIDGIIDRMWDELGYTTRLVATGGMCQTVIPQCKHDIVIDNELTLKGLKLIYEKNKKD